MRSAESDSKVEVDVSRRPEKKQKVAEEAEQALPRVSLVITSYNRAHLIEKAISSALAQDYPNLEIVISDNCSTDNSDQVIRKYAGDPRIKYSVNERNIGMVPNFDKATRQLATGKYITYVSSDDYLVNPTFVSEAIARIRQNPRIIVVSGINVAEYTATNLFHVDCSYPFYKETFYKRPYVSGKEVFLSYPRCHSISFGGALMDREKLIEVNAFEGKVLSGDAQVILKLLLMGDAAFIDKETYVARRHGGNATATVSEARTYLDNLVYIDAPYELALREKILDEETLRQWRSGMYVTFLSQCMEYFYQSDREQYRILSHQVKSNYPEVYRKITNNLHWWFFCTVFASKCTGAIYKEIIAFLVRVKGALTARALKAAHQ